MKNIIENLSIVLTAVSCVVIAVGLDSFIT